MTTKDGLDFEAIAREIIIEWEDGLALKAPSDIKNDMHIDITQALKDAHAEGQRVGCCNVDKEVIGIIEQKAYERGLAEGLKNNTQELIAVCECEYTREVDADGNQIVVQCNYHKEMGEYYTRGYHEGAHAERERILKSFNFEEFFIEVNKSLKAESQAKHLYHYVIDRITRALGGEKK